MRGRLDAKITLGITGLKDPIGDPHVAFHSLVFVFYKNVFYKNIEAEIFQNLIMIRISPRLKRI